MRFEATRSQLFDSFAEVPAAWHELCPSDDLAMDPRVLSVFQRTLADQCRCWGLVVFDAAGVAIGCAALCLFPTELIESSNPAVARGRDWVRRFWPSFGRMRVLFCGLPVPSGSTHLRVREGTCMQAVVAEVDRAMRLLGRESKARLLVFKELDAASDTLAAALSAVGYIRGDIPPMHELHGAFTGFADYSEALKSRYRAQVQRSQKKLVAAGFEVVCGRGSAFFAEHFDAGLHPLYVAVQQMAEQKLELMPLAFFQELAKELGDEALLTLIRREGRVCAFTFAITRGRTHYNLYSGLDYALNNQGDLYFNLFYNDMDQAFIAGATSLHLGQTSDAFKARLGSTTQPLWFFARARPAVLNGVLHLAAPWAFPKVAAVERHDVFATTHSFTKTPDRP